jgi:hypothetical protein
MKKGITKTPVLICGLFILFLHGCASIEKYWDYNEAAPETETAPQQPEAAPKTEIIHPQAEAQTVQEAETVRQQAEERTAQETETTRQQAEARAAQEAEAARQSAEARAVQEAEVARQQAEARTTQEAEAARQRTEAARQQAEARAAQEAEAARQQAKTAAAANLSSTGTAIQETQTEVSGGGITVNPTVQVIPAMPDSNSTKTYTVQIGSFAELLNAEKAGKTLTDTGFTPAIEQFNDYYRVVVYNLKAADLADVVNRLGNAGFTTVWLREDR